MSETDGRNTDVTIDGLLRQFGLVPNQPAKEPEKPNRLMFGASIVAEFVAWVLLFVGMISLGVAVVGIVSMASLGSFLNLGVLNAAALAIGGSIAASTLTSTATSVRKLAQNTRFPMGLKRYLSAAGIPGL